MGKKYSLPKKLSAKESSTDNWAEVNDGDNGDGIARLPASFPRSTTNFRKDFIEQAKRLKEIAVLGPTPERLTKPDSTLKLKEDGTLSGDIASVKSEGKGTTIDLEEGAKAVNEGVKKPTFKRKSKDAAESTIPTEGTTGGPIKDERESDDKQPKEAVACEARFPSFNAREKAFINRKDEKGVRAAMADGSLSKVRGRQILYSMGATESAEEPEVTIPQASDKGKPLEQPASEEVLEEKGDGYKITEEMSRKLVASDRGSSAKESLEGIIDTEIGDEYNCKVTYTSKSPLEGQITHLDRDTAKKITTVLEGLGVKARTLTAKEDCSILFTEEEPINTTKWYALVINKQDPSRVSQLTLTTSNTTTEEEVRNYLLGIYGQSGVLQISTTKLA